MLPALLCCARVGVECEREPEVLTTIIADAEGPRE